MPVRFDSAKKTQAFAQKVADVLLPGDILLLEGDLGAGKTTFTKGLAQGLGISSRIKSPTFMLIREYHEGSLPLYHMDVYRLENGGADDLGLEDYFDGDGVCVVEWAHFVKEYLPKNYVTLTISKDAQDDNARIFSFSGVGARGKQLAEKLATLASN